MGAEGGTGFPGLVATRSRIMRRGMRRRRLDHPVGSGRIVSPAAGVCALPSTRLVRQATDERRGDRFLSARHAAPLRRCRSDPGAAHRPRGCDRRHETGTGRGRAHVRSVASAGIPAETPVQGLDFFGIRLSRSATPDFFACSFVRITEAGGGCSQFRHASSYADGGFGNVVKRQGRDPATGETSYAEVQQFSLWALGM